MVNTRRMESGGSVPYSGHRYRTRRTNGGTTGIECSSDSDTESDESQGGEDSLSSPEQGLRLKEREIRNCRKRVTLKKRRPLSMYSSHKLHDNMESYNPNDSDDGCYSLRYRNTLRRSKQSMSEVERRTALSLRPLIAKSYVDRSPQTCNSDDSDATGVRRSTRQRNFRYRPTSWITDNQMPKKGYPNVDYSEEDSRDVENHDDTKGVHRVMEVNTRRSDRHSVNGMSPRRQIKRNTKYIHDYETVNINVGRRNSNRDENISSTERSLRNHRDSFDKDDKETEGTIQNSRTNARLLRRRKVVQRYNNDDAEDEDDDDEEDEQIDEDDDVNVDETESGKQNGEKSGNENVPRAEECQNKNITSREKVNGSKEPSSESEGLKKTRNRKKLNMLKERYSPRRTRTATRKMIDSSSSSEEEKVYLLRDRQPKQKPVQDLNALIARDRKEKLRYNKRRKISTSSTSTESSSSDDRCRNKYSKSSKNAHSKGEQLKSGAGGSKVIPIGPEDLDPKIKFSSVGGLDSHIQCLKEMILLPMMYPEVFKKFLVEPPRGVLFYGPPGTGKTLIARALANECSFGSRKVAFFMRKGADLLSKWIGESEKQLRLLFAQAAEMKPSIIFFDELDGLAPVRSSRQDQIHASIVSTLLALMDGLDNRGEVIVIGATNRIDAIDPALRRPGRFDRELYFPLPPRKEREEILNVHVSQWVTPPSSQLMGYLAENSVGYCGSDLRALCSEAVIQSFRRTYPQVYNSDYKLLLDPDCVKIEKIDFLRAKSLLIPSSHRVSQCIGRKMLPVLKPLLDNHFKTIMSILEKTFPHGVNPKLAKVKLAVGIRPAQLLLVGKNAEYGQTTHLAPAIVYTMEHVTAHILDLPTLFSESTRSPEEACVQIFNEVKRTVPSVLYIPSINNWWNLINDTVKAIFISQVMHLDPNSPVLILATSDESYETLPAQITSIFSHYRKEVYEINTPNSECRRAFFKGLLFDACLRQPRPPRPKATTPPPLSRAPTPPTPPIPEEKMKKLFEQEERTLRELRIFLRDMCKKLANNRLFFMFTKPVDTQEVPDYPTIIKQPMDLETMMTKVDFHHYECAKEFLEDIELICQNALEYNPAKTSADKQIRHRACSLRDYAYTLIKNEMDSDFEEKCQEISENRHKRKVCVSKYLPPFLQTPNMENIEKIKTDSKDGTQQRSNKLLSVRTNLCRKRKSTCWQRGLLGKKKKRKENPRPLDTTPEDHTEDKTSDDEAKENNPQICSNTTTVQQNNDVSNSFASENNENVSVPSNTSALDPIPLTVKCENPSSKSESGGSLLSLSSKCKVNDLMSPSELLDVPLDFDDIDQALHEITSENPSFHKGVEISEKELHNVLDQVVHATKQQPLQLLLDLHFELSKTVHRYTRTNERRKLPSELLNELKRYNKEVISKK